MGAGDAHDHSHGHSHGPPPELAIGRTAQALLLGFLLLVGLATVGGAAAMWPSDGPAPIPFAAKGSRELTVTLTEIGKPCPVLEFSPDKSGAETAPDKPPPEGCNRLRAEIDGTDTEIQAPPYAVRSGLKAGDKVRVLAIPDGKGGVAAYAFMSVDRDTPLLLALALFVLVVVAVARWRGLMALLGLVAAGLVIGVFMLPALIAGSSGVAVSLVGCSSILFIVLYLAHGVSLRTSAALAGTLVGIGVTAAIGLLSIQAMRLSGISEDGGDLLLTHAPDLDFRGLLGAGLILTGLGVLNDVTITQASSVWELRAANPELTRLQLYASAMRIGRDHIASTIYTIVFAYSGTAISMLLLYSLYDRSWLALATSDQITEEIVRTLASAIGLVLTVPATTAIAALVVTRSGQGRVGGRRAQGARRKVSHA